VIKNHQEKKNATCKLLNKSPIVSGIYKRKKKRIKMMKIEKGEKTINNI